uniref:Tolllike receptor 6 [Tribolium castaneum] n=1 Tax=Lepeophtheirus salmonis TaxID=72036 RepID=A0A0K2TAB3_LEPSM
MTTQYLLHFLGSLFIVSLLKSTISHAETVPCHLQDEVLSCQLRILQESGEGSEHLLDSSELRNVKSLKVKCSNLFYFESHLKSEHFGNLPSLEDLTIEYCKIRRLPPRAFSGLSSLKRLSIQTHNSEWSSVLMEMESHSLFNLNKVEELNLAYNNIWFLPQNELCHTENLRLLNLSHNHFVEMSDMKLMSTNGNYGQESLDACGLKLKVLDLSHNLLSAVKTSDLIEFEGFLEELHLEYNQIGILSEDSLVGLRALKSIDVSHNRLVALPPTIFRNSTGLESISVVNNSLTLLTPGLFKFCKSLVSLNLSRNSISSQLLSPDTFSGLQSLKVLDLSFNELTNLKKGLWSALESLEVLNLSNNRLHIAKESSLFPVMLKSLFLSHNDLVEMNVEAFSGLFHLESLSLDNNKFKDFPISTNNEQGAFLKDASLTLEDLTLSGNYLKKIPEFVKPLLNLRTLDLGENEIANLDSTDLNSLSNLYGLRLASNTLNHIAADVFINCTSIHVLNLAHNALNEIEKGAFDGLKSSLKALRLDNNNLKDMNGLLSGLEQLQWLNISSNDLQWFDYAFIPSSLEWLDLRRNAIEELGNYYTLLSRFNLKTLDAGHNYIKKLTKSSLPSSLEVISLNDNEIQFLEEHIFANKNNLIKVDLRNNELDSLSLDALTIGKVINQKDLPEFHLSGNPFNCDCNLEWLPRNHEISISGHHPKVIDLDQIYCSGEDNMPISSKKPEDFICQYKTHCFSLCMCCDFYACDCRMQCPEGCNCFHDAEWNTNIIECSSKSRTDVPLLIPMDATDIYLDGNNLTHVDSQSFIGRKRVASLYLNNSAIISISGQTLSGLSNLKVLHLENNEIREIIGDEFHFLSSLRELYLNNNNLIRIAALAFENLANLVFLRLDGNLLTSFPVWDLTRHNPFLNRLYVGENMWSCECEFARPFQRFLYQHVHKIRDGGHIQCFSDNFVSHDVDISTPISPCAKLKKDFRSNRLENTAISTQNHNNLIPIIASVILVAIVTLIGFLSLCVFKSKIKTWLYDKSTEIYESSRRSNTSTVSLGEANVGASKLFDVYVSYASQDCDFVDQSLAPTLEHGNTSYRLCLHQRDFPPTVSLYDTVAVATESSSRVLIILSKAYVHTEWPRMKAPLKNALQNKFCKLIILQLEDIDEDELGSSEPELKQYLKVCATVRWGSPGFLNKLRFFLPEPVFLTFQRNVTLRTLQPQPPSVGINGSNNNNNDPSWAYTVMRRSSESPSHHPSMPNALLCPKYSLTTDPNPSSSSVMGGSVYSHHTYQSIPELAHLEGGGQRHVYHTLEPSKFLLSQSQSIYLNKNLDIVKSTSSSSGLEDCDESIQVCHNHTNSTSSGVQLIPRQGSNGANENNEYVV